MSEVTPDGAATTPAPSEVMTYPRQTVLLAPSPVSPLAGPKHLYLRGSVWTVLGLVLLGTGLFGSAVMMPVRIALVLLALVILFKGLAKLGTAKLGKGFDLSYWLACGWLAVLILAAIFAPLLPLGEYKDTVKTLAEPGFASPSLLSAHPLGTNNFGLDLLARALFGARASLTVAVCAVLIGIVVGGTIGVMAGYFRGKLDATVGILTNSLLAVPALVLLIALAAVLPSNLRNITLALSILCIPSMVRIARANTILVAQREFVLAARAMGATKWRVIWRELVPNVLVPVAALGLVTVSGLIVAEASLSFLGLGIAQPNPTWGNMIAEGQGGIAEKHPFIVLVPGVFLFLTVFSFNLIGEKYRSRM
ncbi:ABC transporter permease [Rhodococcus spelaei]|nr:ABC transporter permease [Rhodococcus spelaei]